MFHSDPLPALPGLLPPDCPNISLEPPGTRHHCRFALSTLQTLTRVLPLRHATNKRSIGRALCKKVANPPLPSPSSSAKRRIPTSYAGQIPSCPSSRKNRATLPLRLLNGKNLYASGTTDAYPFWQSTNNKTTKSLKARTGAAPNPIPQVQQQKATPTWDSQSTPSTSIVRHQQAPCQIAPFPVMLDKPQ